jgi:hypothetical protein
MLMWITYWAAFARSAEGPVAAHRKITTTQQTIERETRIDIDKPILNVADNYRRRHVKAPIIPNIAAMTRVVGSGTRINTTSNTRFDALERAPGLLRTWGALAMIPP